MKQSRILLLTIITCTFSFFSHSQPNNSPCKKFSKGTYTYKEEPYTSVIIKRNHRVQKESDTRTGIKLRYHIKWTDDCEYELIQKWTNDPRLKGNNGGVIKVRITEVHNDSYEYVANFRGDITRYTIVRKTQKRRLH